MAEQDCIFCKIVQRDIESKIVYADESVIAFEDVNPKAPTHVLIIPREHMESLNDASQGDEPLLGHMLRMAAKVANQLGVAEEGFRTVINTGAQAGQTVQHLHLHILGGRPLSWPPG